MTLSKKEIALFLLHYSQNKKAPWWRRYHQGAFVRL